MNVEETFYKIPFTQLLGQPETFQSSSNFSTFSLLKLPYSIHHNIYSNSMEKGKAVMCILHIEDGNPGRSD